MSDDAPAARDRHLQGEIDALRGQYTDTQELYREVCVLLFFRHGITPTANKLYQLVRKGSMSAPGEALSNFWSTLREKSRVRIEHPDLPEELRGVAGDVIAALWQRAQALAEVNFTAARAEAQAAMLQATADAQVALLRATTAEQALADVRQALKSSLSRTQQLEQDVAREQGARAALEQQIEQAVEQRREFQHSLEDAQLDFQMRLAEQRDAAHLAQERYQSDLRRVLLDIDRERTTCKKIQKELDQVRREGTEKSEQARVQMVTLGSDLVQTRQKLSGAESALMEARSAAERFRIHLEKAMARPQRKVPVRKARVGKL